MAQSRRNKDRKEKLLKYKKSKKMSDLKAPEQRPFHQVPAWETTDTFEINGQELEALYGFFNIFAPALTSVQQIFARGVKAGKIRMDYVYEDGSPVEAEEVKAYTDKLNEYFKNLSASTKQTEGEVQTKEIATETPQPEAPRGKILTMTGEPATPENV
jgi:hypothetical protein